MLKKTSIVGNIQKTSIIGSAKKTSIVGNIKKTSIVGNLQQTSLSKVVTVKKSSAVNVGIIPNLNLKNCLVEKFNSIQYDALAHIFFVSWYMNN